MVFEDGWFDQVVRPDLEEFLPLLDLRFQQLPTNGAFIDIEQGDVIVKHLVQQDDELHHVGVGLLPEGFLAPAKEISQKRGDCVSQSVGVQVVVERVIAVV